MIRISCEGDSAIEVLSHVKGFASLISAEVPAHTGTIPEAIVKAAAAAPAAVNLAPAPIAPTASAPAAPPPAYSSPQQPPITSQQATIAPQPPIAPPHAPAVPTAPAPTYTLDQISRAGADLITAKRELIPALTGLMAKYGVQTIDKIKPDQYGALATDLRALGANI